MTIAALQDVIAQGENTNVEFKSARIRPETLAREIVAMANASGGVILLGVEDDKRISGLEAGKNYEEWCMNIARNSMNPPLQILYSELTIQNMTIAILEIPKGKDKPYQTNDAKFFIRVGSINRMASVPELLRLFQQSGRFHFDSTPVERTSLRNVNLPKIAAYFDAYKVNFEVLSESEKISLLQNTDILKEEGQLSVAGLLIFGVYPQKYLFNASVAFAHFAGTEMTAELLDKQTIEGNLDLQIDTTTAVIKNNLRRPSDIVGNQRLEQPMYPDKVFRELIVNACCHRNYSISGSQIRVFLSGAGCRWSVRKPPNSDAKCNFSNRAKNSGWFCHWAKELSREGTLSLLPSGDREKYRCTLVQRLSRFLRGTCPPDSHRPAETCSRLPRET